MKLAKTTAQSVTKVVKTAMPIAFPKNQPLLKGTILSADIGGTKTRFALFKKEAGLPLKMVKKVSLNTNDYKSFQEAYGEFRQRYHHVVDRVSMAVAGPVLNDEVQGTNFNWKISLSLLKQLFDQKPCFLLNDLEAAAYGLAGLAPEDCLTINGGIDQPGNAAMIAPGTGLGEVGLFYDGAKLHPFATEGGHCDFSPRHELEFELWNYLDYKLGHVSWERLISGAGIVRIYKFLCRKRAHSYQEHCPQFLEDPVAISTKAINNQCVICRETLDLFFKFLAVECAQLALKFKALGGIYITGGIVPKVLSGLDTTVFRSHFTQVGRMSAMLSQLPVKVVKREDLPLCGASYYAAGGLVLS